MTIAFGAAVGFVICVLAFGLIGGFGTLFDGEKVEPGKWIEEGWRDGVRPMWEYFNPIGNLLLTLPLALAVVLFVIGTLPAFLLQNSLRFMWKAFQFLLIRRSHWQ